MAFCTRCGTQLVEGSEHVCTVSAHATTAATSEQGIASPSTASGNSFFPDLLQQIKLGITAPNELAANLRSSSDIWKPIIYYVLFGLVFGLMSAAFTNKVATSLTDLFSGMMFGGGSSFNAYADSAVQSSIPFGTILVKTTLLMAIIAASYAVSFALVSRLFKGSGSIVDYFKALSGTFIPATLVLLVAAVLVNASVFIGAIAVLVAFIYLSYFPVLQAKQISGLSVSKFVYSYPLVHVIPLVLLYILAKAGL